MRKFTKLSFFTLCMLAVFSFSSKAEVTLPEGGLYYGPKPSEIGWSASDYYKVIDLQASTLTDATLYPRTGADNGSQDNGYLSAKVPFVSGNISVPLYNYDAGSSSYVESGSNYNIVYYNCIFAPDHYTSAYTKLNFYGMDPSGAADATTKNDGTVLLSSDSPYETPGFIELCRIASSDTTKPANVDCGYIELDNLYGVDKIQWAYSSTSWKRGVICEVDWGDGWERQRTIPSDVTGYATFSEQGYNLEEEVGFTSGEDVNTPVKMRFRIYDSDTITFADQVDLPADQRDEDYYYQDHSSFQVVRIHSIKVYSSLSGSELAQKILQGVEKPVADKFLFRKVGNEVYLEYPCAVEVYSISGSLVKSEMSDNVDLSALAKGIYLIRIHTKTGLVVKKVVI